MSKSTKDAVLQRTKEITALLIKGHSREEIVQYSSMNWNIGERQADKYIKGAKDLIASSVKRTIDYDYAKAIRRYEELYKSALENKDYRAAININKELTQLQGLHKSQIEHSGEVKFICSVPD